MRNMDITRRSGDDEITRKEDSISPASSSPHPVITSSPHHSSGRVVAIGTFDGIHKGHAKVLDVLSGVSAQYDLEPMVAMFPAPPRAYLNCAPVNENCAPVLPCSRAPVNKGNSSINSSTAAQQHIGTPAEGRHTCHKAGTGARVLTTIDERRQLLSKEFGIDRVAVLPTDADFFSTSALDFINDYVIGKWNARVLVCGDNFSMGKNREFSVKYLTSENEARNPASHSEDNGVKCYRVKDSACNRDLEIIKVGMKRNGSPISSSRIRGYVTDGDFKESLDLLGHYYPISGKVVFGNKLAGKFLGAPTANIEVPANKMLPLGVFKAWIPGLNKEAVVNIGTKPTLKNMMRRSGDDEMMRKEGFASPSSSHHHSVTVEAHILDFHGDLYGRHLAIELTEKIREEKRFKNFNELRNQILKDIMKVRERGNVR
ncbi:riboflavin kinase [Elusimicrobiota bacterium]